MNWKATVEFRGLCKIFNDSNDEFEEIKRVKPLWIDRFNSYPLLKHFVPSLKKVKTIHGFDKWLNRVYDYCDDNSIWVKW